jgi:hypothetical protein
VDKYILKNEIGRTPEDVDFSAAVLKASKVFPVDGALMEPTIPGYCR